MEDTIKCVIFDLDDTLYNEREYVEAAMKNVAAFLSEQTGKDREKVYLELISILDSHGRGKVFNIWLQNNNVDISVKELVERYRATECTLHMYEDASELIAVLKDRGYYMGIITDGCSRVQHNKIDGLNICSDFDEIIVTDDYGTSKPDTLPYELIIRAFENNGINAENCVYIGDNPRKDFVGARKLGIHTIRIVRKVGDNMNVTVFSEEDAENRVYNLMEVLDII